MAALDVRTFTGLEATVGTVTTHGIDGLTLTASDLRLKLNSVGFDAASTDTTITKSGDRLAITVGMPFGTPGATNVLRIAWVE